MDEIKTDDRPVTNVCRICGNTYHPSDGFCCFSSEPHNAGLLCDNEEFSCLQADCREDCPEYLFLKCEHFVCGGCNAETDAV